MEEKFNFCDDFVIVLESSRKLFEGKASLRLAGVVYCIFNYYINGIDITPQEEKLYRVIMSAPIKTRLELMNYLTEEKNLALRSTESNKENYGVVGLLFGQDFMNIINQITDDCPDPDISCTRFLHSLLLRGMDYYSGDKINLGIMNIHPIGQKILQIFVYNKKRSKVFCNTYSKKYE